MSRVEKTLKNTISSLGVQAGNTILNFISRTVLIKKLGETYLGINGLFSNILTMLSLTELGVGAALIYLMYKPMAENDEERLNVLMGVYSKIYTAVGIIVLIIGIGLTPFITFFMKETPDIQHIYLIYMLYVINMASSYFLVYKSSIITVAQKAYIVTLVKFAFNIIQNITQIVVLLMTKNYILFYFCTIIFTLVGNIVISKKAEKLFPFLKKKSKKKLEQEEKKEIIKNVSAMFVHKIGSFIVLGTDNLLIGKFVGIVEVGLYSNYVMFTAPITSLVSSLMDSVTASVGNLVNYEDKERVHQVFKNIYFMTCWLVGFCAVALCVLCNPFITIWLGERYIFAEHIVMIIVLNFYLTLIRKPANVFKETLGLFWNDRYKSIIEAMVNLVVSIILVKKVGIFGVFLGTTISTVAVCLWVEPYILYKRYFGIHLLDYFKMFFKYTLTNILAIVIIKVIMAQVTVNGFFTFVIAFLLSMIIPNALYILFFYKSREMKYFVDIFKGILSKFKGFNRVRG